MHNAEGRSWSWGILLATALLVGPSSALATDGAMGGQDAMGDEDVAQEDSDDHQEMLELSAEGNELYESGQFEEAAAVYSEAYEIYPQPILLKNEMITRYLIEECETAIELGEEFIESGEGSEEDEEDVEAVFGECSLDLARESIDDGDWVGAEEWLDYGESYLFEAQLEAESEALRSELDDEIGETETVEEIDEPGPATRQIGGWSSLGVGAGLLVGAGLWHMSWESRHSELEQLQRDGDPAAEELEAELDEDFGTVRWAIPTLYGVGAAAALAGAGLLVWPMISGDDSDSAAMIRPDVGIDRAGAVFSIQF